MKLFLDIITGEFRNTLNGARLPAVKFCAGDVIPLEITLVEGRTNVTATALASGTLRGSIKGFPLASVSIADVSLTLSTDKAVGEFDLSGVGVSNYLSSNVPASSSLGECVFEVQIEKGSTKETVSQSRSLIARDLVTVGTVQADFSSEDFSSTDFKTT